MVRRGQAALEFLTTYAWAFLVILIAIGALAYFGVMNPQQFIPERCTFSSEFGCDDYQIDRNGDDVTVNLFIRNNLGSTATVNNVTVRSLEALTSGVTLAEVTCAETDVVISPSEADEFTCTFTEGTDYDVGEGGFPSEGSKTRFDLRVNYKEVGGRYDHSTQGEIFGTVN